MEFKTFEFEKENKTGIIELNRPEVLNALNLQFFTDLNSLIDQLEKDPVTLIITGIGKGFAAGADISEMAEMSAAEASQLSRTGQHTFNRLEKYPGVVIAAINGYALGGGCELCLSCDIRLAGKEAKFGQPEVKLGLIPGYAATHKLAKHVGLGNALFLLTTAITIDADQAMRMGLVQEICEQEKLLERAKEITRMLEKSGPLATKTVKMVTRSSNDLAYNEGTQLETEYFGKMFEEQGKEGMKAFLEKRKANW